MSECRLIYNILTGDKNFMTVVNIKTVYLTCLRLKAQEPSLTASIIGYPVVKIIRDGIRYIVSRNALSAGFVISANVNLA